MLATAKIENVPLEPSVGHKIPCDDSKSHSASSSESGVVPVARAVAVIEDIPMDTLVDSLALHMRLFNIGIVAQVCVGLRAATLYHVELPARACEALRMWRATARCTRVAWQTVMMWRGNASRMAEDLYANDMIAELDEMMKAEVEDDDDGLTDEEVDFLDHHIMKQSWESLSARVGLSSALQRVKDDLQMLAKR